MKRWYRVHIYDIGPERWESIIGPVFKTERSAWVWFMTRRFKYYIADWKIKEHTL